MFNKKSINNFFKSTFYMLSFMIFFSCGKEKNNVDRSSVVSKDNEAGGRHYDSYDDQYGDDSCNSKALKKEWRGKFDELEYEFEHNRNNQKIKKQLSTLEREIDGYEVPKLKSKISTLRNKCEERFQRKKQHRKSKQWIKKASDTLEVETPMGAGEKLRSENKRFTLKFQKDLNLVIYDKQQGDKAIWSSGVKRKFKNRRSNEAELWLQEDGNIVTYVAPDRNPGDAIWASGTMDRRSKKIIITNKGHLEIHNVNDEATWSTKNHPHIGY